MFCKRKTEKLEAFRVGYHPIPKWLKKELKTKIKSIEVHNDAEGKPEIIIELPHLVAINGDWIIKQADGRLVKYKHENFTKLFEVSEY